MRELSIHIKVFMLNSKTQNPYTFIADDVSFSPVPEVSDAGTCYNCSVDIPIELPTPKILSAFSQGRFTQVEFTDTKGKRIRIGNKDTPAITSITPLLNSATLKIDCKMLESPLL